MTVRIRVALHGFSRFEHDALFFCFKHTDAGDWAYEVVDEMEESDFIVADADRELTDGRVASAGRTCDTLFVGNNVPEAATSYVIRPINSATHPALA